MDAPFRATYQTKRMLYEMMLCAEHRGAYVGYVRGEFSRTLTGFFQEVSSAFRFPYTFSWSWSRWTHASATWNGCPFRSCCGS